jgi:hypothetical protein
MTCLRVAARLLSGGLNEQQHLQQRQSNEDGGEKGGESVLPVAAVLPRNLISALCLAKPRRYRSDDE